MLYIVFDEEYEVYGIFNNVSIMLIHYKHMLSETENNAGKVLIGAFDEFGASFEYKEPDEFLQQELDDITKDALAKKSVEKNEQ